MNADLEGVFLDYYGEKLGDTVVVITPETPMGFGVSIQRKNELVLMPTVSVSIDESNFVAFLLHEISHSYVNPQTDLRTEAVKEMEGLYEPIKNSMTKQAYSTWYSCLNEHLVRANVIKMIEMIYGKEVRENLIKIEEKKDFIYIRNVLTSLDRYTDSRNDYPTYQMYYDTLLHNLKQEI